MNAKDLIENYLTEQSVPYPDPDDMGPGVEEVFFRLEYAFNSKYNKGFWNVFDGAPSPDEINVPSWFKDNYTRIENYADGIVGLLKYRGWHADEGGTPFSFDIDDIKWVALAAACEAGNVHAYADVQDGQFEGMHWTNALERATGDRIQNIIRNRRYYRD